MFQKARLKLTAWYLLIIMVISVSFSVAVYKALTYELNRILRIEKMRQEGIWSPKRKFIIPFTSDDQISQTGFIIPQPNAEVLEEAKERLKLILIAINLSILGLSGAAGYFLAGRTLRPIKQMIDEQNRFITDASHELRTPLTSLKSEIEVNLRDNKLTLSGARQLLSSNLEEVNNLQYLSDNLIKLAQYQKNSGNNFFEKVTLHEIFDEAEKKVFKLARNKKISIQNHLKDFTLFADRQGLIELIVILLDNAIKYSEKETVITVTGKKSDKNVLLQIHDQGIGIEKDALPYLFDRFYRSDKSRTKVRVSGYGLGLSIAKQIVEKHNGSVDVETKIGEGTTFSVRLPIIKT